MRIAILIPSVLPLLAGSSLAGADGRWDGLWYRNTAKTHASDHTYTLTRVSGGRWRYDDGTSIFQFSTDGRPSPEPLVPDFTVTGRQKGDTELDFTEWNYGREAQRFHKVLAGDGKALTGAYTRIYPDGREVVFDVRAIRVGTGSGLEGTWKELADNPASPSAAPTTRPAPAAQLRRPYWVISTMPDGVMTWFIPATGELIRGKADGRARPVTGPQQPAGRTFVWIQVAPNRLEFYARDNGHLIERATETLSADGRTFTDELWSPAHDDERDVNVYEKE